MAPLLPRQSAKSGVYNHELMEMWMEVCNQLMNREYTPSGMDGLYREVKFTPDRLYRDFKESYKEDSLMSVQCPIPYLDPLLGQEEKFSISAYEMRGASQRYIFNEFMSGLFSDINTPFKDLIAGRG